MKYYYWLKLWYWWNFLIKRDEFHIRLNYSSFAFKYKQIDLHHISEYITRQRNIAHDLTSGSSIVDIDMVAIQKAHIHFR